MPKFALLFSGPPTNVPAGTDTDDVWRTWIQKLGSDYHSGSAFPMQGNVLSNGQVQPFAPAKTSMGGYVVIDATDLNAATDVAKTSPHATWGGEVEVRPCRDLD